MICVCICYVQVDILYKLQLVQSPYFSCILMNLYYNIINSIRDARTPQPREIFLTLEYYHAYRNGNTFNECLSVVLEQNLWLT